MVLLSLLFLAAQDGWSTWPGDAKGVAIDGPRVRVDAEKWSFAAAPGDLEHVEVEAVVRIEQAARKKGFFGQDWSVWPDLTYTDGGYDAGVLLRGGYRVQLSQARQELALVKVPDGGYLRVVPCPVRLGEPHVLRASIQGSTIVASVDGAEKIRYVDRIRPLTPGRAGVGGANGAKVTFERRSVKVLPAAGHPAAEPHAPKLAVRTWLGGRAWVFDGDEPILLLPTREATYINNVKLRPGWKPLLSWNSHWDIQTQGAYKEGDNRFEAIETSGGGATLSAAWSFRHVKDRFVVHSSMTVGWDPARQVYTYDVAGKLDVLAGEPFHFRHGYDFEHHTPLDPFRWQYLVLRREGGELVHRPVYPVDPGVLRGLAQERGLRVWFGRHNGDLLVAPAVEYDLPEPGRRKLSSAVCAAFYDTGVAFEPETAPAGTQVRVKYRYTGYPAAEAEALFKASRIYESPMLDPDHHYVFADEWPKLTFSQAEPMSRTWIYGRRPFMSGHNRRPTYAWERGTGQGAGFALRCGPGGYGQSRLPAPSPLPKGRYVVRALVKSVNAHGPGGRIELRAVDKDDKTLRAETHHVGHGTFEWRRIAFATDVPSEAPGLAIAFGNAGTGDVLFGEVEIVPLESGEAVPGAAVAPPSLPPPPEGAIADYRMEEGRGHHVFDYAGGAFGPLELANVEWVVDEGRPALRFGGSGSGRGDFARDGTLDRNYLGTRGYVERSRVPVAVSGYHGGDPLKPGGLTLSAWIKPEAAQESGKADVVGVGARRVILSLHGGRAPYRLAARIDVQDAIASEALVQAGRWHHVAVTCEPEGGVSRVRLWLDGRPVAEGETRKPGVAAPFAPSLVLGTEIFYFHDAYYRGLIGRTLVFGRSLEAPAIGALAR
ncbi:MAG TPA: LamG-like jellyroll fold domain-containing protein [Planctomycetota bacterium]|nr:LamG-like jellyroll fold domain-containing protein [Planctomycetota bacterium]